MSINVFRSFTGLKAFIKLLLIAVIAMGSYTSSLATHVLGADITYKAIDTLKFEFIVKIYRECRGVPLANISSATRVRCEDGSNASGVTMTLKSIRTITSVCDTASDPCSPQNTYGTGKGIEEHLYSTIIDFKDQTYANLIKCCKIIFETGQCCRNGAINTGAANQNFYTYALLDLCKGPMNSSPVITSDPVAFLCCNVPVSHYIGATDNVDHDSLSYKLSHPLKAYNSIVPYSSPFSPGKPFTVYDPGGTGKIDPNVNPPIGFYFDSLNGGVIFTPTKCDEVTVMVMEIREWRKDTNGTYDLIGITQRDINLWVESCSGNNPPTLSGPYEYDVVEGDSLIFDIKSDDKVFVPPPPATAPDPDTVTVSWSEPFSNVSLKIIDTTAIHPTVRFSWKALKGPGATGSYQFTVTATDNSCPYNNVTNRTYLINVLSDTTTSIDKPERIDLSIAPNPNPGEFILFSSKSATKVLRMVNITGKEVGFSILERSNEKNSFKIVLDEPKPGIYFLEIGHSGYHQVIRLVVF